MYVCVAVYVFSIGCQSSSMSADSRASSSLLRQCRIEDLHQTNQELRAEVQRELSVSAVPVCGEVRWAAGGMLQTAPWVGVFCLLV